MNNREKWLTIAVIGERTRRNNVKDAALAKDMAAYKRLRHEGHQPPQVGGSAALERDADLPMEIEMGKVFTKEDRPHAEEGWAISKEIGLRGPKL
jgi:hypothetical protein